MKAKAQARLEALQADIKTAQDRLQALQTEGQELTRFLAAAQGAMEVLRELLGQEEESDILG